MIQETFQLDITDDNDCYNVVYNGNVIKSIPQDQISLEEAEQMLIDIFDEYFS